MFAATRGGDNPLNPNGSYYVGSVKGTTSVSLSSLSLQQNDLVLAISGFTGDTATTPGVTTSGYTQAAYTIRVGTGDDLQLYVGYKVMGATPDTSVGFTASPLDSASTNSAVYVWRNINTASPMAATATTATGGTTPNSPAISFSGSAIVVAVGILRTNDLITGAPSGMSNFVSQSVGSTYASCIGIASAYATSTYDPAAFLISSTNAWCAATLALTV